MKRRRSARVRRGAKVALDGALSAPSDASSGSEYEPTKKPSNHKKARRRKVLGTHTETHTHTHTLGQGA